MQQILDSNSLLLLVKEEHFTSLAHSSIAIHLVIQWCGPSAKDDKVQLLYCSRYILNLSSFVLSLLPPAVFSVPSLSSSALSLPPYLLSLSFSVPYQPHLGVSLALSLSSFNPFQPPSILSLFFLPLPFILLLLFKSFCLLHNSCHQGKK
jgi:hypothetical protein